MELDERVRTQARQVALDGPALLRAASTDGYAAIAAAGVRRRRCRTRPSGLLDARLQ